MIYQLVVVLAVVAAVSAKHFSSDADHQKLQWKVFKKEHKRTYETPEEDAKRFGHFLDHLRMADERNEQQIKAGGSAVHGITQFSDLSQEEFAQRYLNVDMTQKIPAADRGFVASNFDAPNGAVGLVDWTGIYTTAVKNLVRICEIEKEFFVLVRLVVIFLFIFPGLLRGKLGLRGRGAGGV